MLLVGGVPGVVRPELEANSTVLDVQDGKFLFYVELTHDSDSVKD